MNWILFIGIMVLGLIVQSVLQSKFSKYSKVPLPNGMSGAEVAMKMLNDNGIYDVKVVPAQGMLTRVELAAARGHVGAIAAGLFSIIRFFTYELSESFYRNDFLIGIIVFSSFPQLLWIGIGLFALTTLFSFVTLPVEINASQRAIAWLDNTGITDYETRPMAVDALRWAAYTYVVAALGSLATLLYYIGIARRD